MATEILRVPEEALADVIEVIRRGIMASRSMGEFEEVCCNLEAWCNDEEEYLRRE